MLENDYGRPRVRSAMQMMSAEKDKRAHFVAQPYRSQEELEEVFNRYGTSVDIVPHLVRDKGPGWIGDVVAENESRAMRRSLAPGTQMTSYVQKGRNSPQYLFGQINDILFHHASQPRNTNRQNHIAFGNTISNITIMAK